MIEIFQRHLIRFRENICTDTWGEFLGLFPLNLKKLLFLCLIIAVPILTINVQRKSGDTDWFLKPFYFVTISLQKLYVGFSSQVRGTTAQYLNLMDIKKDNRNLQNEVSVLKAQLVQLEEIRLENVRLSRLLDFKESTPLDLIPAKVIGHDMIGQHQTLIINKGKNANIVAGQSVVTPDGVVGSVLSVSEKFSQILRVTDRYSDIDAVAQRTRARGIVEGVSTTECQMKYLQRTDDIQIGDLIVTSGFDGVFPKGFPIGTVTKVDKKSYGITQTVLMNPAVSTINIEEVFVVLKVNERQELTREEHKTPEVKN